ncbi:hypothetical protein MXD62_31890 [Frankia sp. Mgl5]|uniref:hypothetical protein n=1 Tax=Frankia sp. Mgl5 TaxID=2933793 RepID=UPI00200DACD4|nr:hypothetical protein [Frankia sp. Mgl5]MCK9931688.1 hypothetical protein [Frankia sp. Mgl5]
MARADRTPGPPNQAVYRFGEQKKTNPGLPAACDTFTFVETLAAAALPTPTLTPGQAFVPAQATPSAPRPP